MASLTFARGIRQVGSLSETGSTPALGAASPLPLLLLRSDDVIDHMTDLIFSACALAAGVRPRLLFYREDATAAPRHLFHNGRLQVGVQHLVLCEVVVQSNRRHCRRLAAVAEDSCGWWGSRRRGRWCAIFEGIASEANSSAVVLVDDGGGGGCVCCCDAAQAGVVDGGGGPQRIDVDSLQAGWWEGVVLQWPRHDDRPWSTAGPITKSG